MVATRPMLRKTLRVLAWVVGGLASLCVALYLVVVAINWRDAEPSAQALRMADAYRDRPAVRDEDNAFVFLMGFGVAPGENPLEMGRKRVAWLQQLEGSTQMDASADPSREPQNHRDAMHPALRKYLAACSPGVEGCVAALAEANRTFDEWRSSEDWLLDRYRMLLELPDWREEVSSLAAAPTPPYQLVMDGQKVLLLHARNRAARGDAIGVRELLASDLRFWRRVLGSSDFLISKMIATAAINRNFKLGAEVVGLLPPERMSGAIPAEWRVEITESERSMRRILTGEWIFVSGVIRNLGAELAEGLPTQDSVLGKLGARFHEPFFQQQDTINRSADYLSRASDLAENVPLSGYKAAANRLTDFAAESTSEANPPRYLYNISGRMIIGYSADYGRYMRRLGDIEGVRQAVLAAIGLRAAKVAPAEISAALAASTLRNPYNGEPFDWDADDEAVIFRGLEPGERGEHRIH